MDENEKPPCPKCQGNQVMAQYGKTVRTLSGEGSPHTSTKHDAPLWRCSGCGHTWPKQSPN